MTFPGAREVDSEFFEASDATSIDGEDLSNDAALARDFVVDPAVPADEVLGWYRTRLEEAGWGNAYQDNSNLNIYLNADGIRHVYAVTTHPADEHSLVSGYNVNYSMTFEP